jgi:hypothetical protein
MSFVTGIMLIAGVGDWLDEQDSPIHQVQRWIEERYRGHLVEVSEHSGGSKHPQFEAWCAGINYMDEDEFIAFVMGLEWHSPENFVLVVNPEEGPARVFVKSADVYRTFTATGGNMAAIGSTKNG